MALHTLQISSSAKSIPFILFSIISEQNMLQRHQGSSKMQSVSYPALSMLSMVIKPSICYKDIVQGDGKQ
jgi:hypothetical protein